MGMFDSVWVACPSCAAMNEFQSKGGDCMLADYHLSDCPDDVMQDINRHAPVECHCGVKYEVDKVRRRAVMVSYSKKPRK